MKTVVIIDDHLMLAESLGMELERRGIAQAEVINPEDSDCLEQLAVLEPDGCLIDLDLGDRLSGGMRFLREAVSLGFSSVIFTGSSDQVQLGRCLEEGAAGVILKCLTFSEVAERVRRLVNDEPVNSDTELLQWVLAAQRFRKARARELEPFDALTPRERAVLQHLLDGMRAEEIAKSDFVGVATVRSQVHAVLQKLGVNSQLEAVAAAHRIGWSQSTPAPVDHRTYA